MKSWSVRRGRLLAVVAVFVGAPVCAEYLAAYMEETGKPGALIAALVVLGPLYGGAALLIREVAVRRGLGWSGILLLAAAFGLAMPGLLDLTLYGDLHSGVGDFDEVRRATMLGPLGISAFATLSYVSTHVLISIGAPLGVLDALAPRYRGRPLLSGKGMVVVAALMFWAAALVRADARFEGYHASTAQTSGAAAGVIVLVVLAFTRLGRPVTTGDGKPVPAVWLVLAGGLWLFATDNVPATWLGVALLVALFAAAVLAIRYWSHRTRWTAAQIGALAAGALIARALAGILAPLPVGVDYAAKATQSMLLFAATLVVAWLVLRHTGARFGRRTVAPGPGNG
ncbi:hypothetical protein GPX89_12080 [Nocardia sp. ET3-3]|uniref:DUF998 domain-containing protein n=1 Tax=Nocardia terrae TaxID=2675851 RepID=A0A7K1UUF3_9NOCA|nr:hypothetical protein [Nocardia terrae]MVU77982.1 hypothetical protein [Nocardia terrae]